MKREAVKCGAKVVSKSHFMEHSSLLHSIHTWCFTSVEDSTYSALVR